MTKKAGAEPCMHSEGEERTLGFLLFFLFIGVQLIDNIVLVLGIQQSEPVTHVYTSTLCSIFFRIFFFPCRPLQSIE